MINWLAKYIVARLIYKWRIQLWKIQVSGTDHFRISNCELWIEERMHPSYQRVFQETNGRLNQAWSWRSSRICGFLATVAIYAGFWEEKHSTVTTNRCILCIILSSRHLFQGIKTRISINSYMWQKSSYRK